LSKNPLLHTDKADKKNHGKGISIVKSIAQKYGGDVVILEKNNEFIVSVILGNRIFT
jgi:two-component system sensor histidine kinase AgrC